ncbi:heparinase II/III family protein, partial [candidate division KSB1 bacterium]|nr:heparinase II/III family protein [candidate division KSB1 bacterium]
MIRKLGLLVVLCAVCCYSQDILSGLYTPEQLSKIILPADQWRPFPKWGESDKWNVVPEAVRLDFITQAEALLGTEWAAPRASVFLDFVRNGNRSRYEAISFGRRRQLAALVLGECFEGKGRFLDDIADGVWAICEETYWGVPAHVGMQKKGSGLPDVTEPTVDLFAAETAALLAWTFYLLEDQLGEISPLLPDRIEYEVKRRIFDVLLERSDFWWMGLQTDPEHHVNNWNPWICSNWLTSVLILEKDRDRRINSIFKICRCLDQFLNPYPRDGGCDEGPGYWSRAGSSLYDCLELLHSASNGKIDVYKEPLIREIGRYIYKVHIYDDYYVNFADASAKTHPGASQVFRFGKAINDPLMAGFGAYLAQRQNVGKEASRGGFGGLGRGLPALFSLNELLAEKPVVPLLRDAWFPDLQVAVARAVLGSAQGFYLAAKGGHNNESHNHNDVGNFLIYYDGVPAIIDIGVEQYTAKT